MEVTHESQINFDHCIVPCFAGNSPVRPAWTRWGRRRCRYGWNGPQHGSSHCEFKLGFECLGERLWIQRVFSFRPSGRQHETGRQAARPFANWNKLAAGGAGLQKPGTVCRCRPCLAQPRHSFRPVESKNDWAAQGKLGPGYPRIEACGELERRKQEGGETGEAGCGRFKAVLIADWK